MYSKSMGMGDGRARGDVRAEIGIREPAAGLREPAYRRAVRVPPNYSGHAFRDGEARSPEQIMSGESHRDRPPRGEDLPTPRFDDLPRVSTLGHREPTPPPLQMDSNERDDRPSSPLIREEDQPHREDRLPVPACHGAEGKTDEGALSRIMEHFPFGHGFGFEELLLLGLMLLLLHEGEEGGDLGETLVLLGVLLLCG